MDPRFQSELYVVECWLPCKALALIEDSMVRPHLIPAVRPHPVVLAKVAIGHPALDVRQRADMGERGLAADHEVELLEDGDGIDDISNIR